MNKRLLGLICKGLIRNRKNILKIAFAVFLSFVFVTGILLFQENMYNWQMAKAKDHFGDWFVMDIRSDSKENDVLTTFPYLESPVTANTVNEIYDEYEENTGIKVGGMSEEFIKRNKITLEKGDFPRNNEEIAMDWDSLLKINQGYEIGDSIELILKDLDSDTGFSKKTYRLAGILTSYTSVWINGHALPGVLMQSDELKSITYDEKNIFCYPLKNYIKEENYGLIYERICENADIRKLGYYNDAVYEIAPWGNELLYQYMYILIMVIGTASISYQVLLYNKGRKSAREMYRRLGAGRNQLLLMYIFENTFIILISAFLGTIIAMTAGKIVCDNVLSGGIHFYTIGAGTIIKIILTLVISIVFSSLVYVIEENKKVKKAKNRIKMPQTLISPENFVWQTSKRFIKSNGLIINASVRIFSLIMAMILVFCTLSVISAYKSYIENNAVVDLIGYSREDEATNYYYYYLTDPDKFSGYMKETNGNTPIVDRYINTKADDDNIEFNYNNLMKTEMTKKIKCGRTNFYNGLSKVVISNLQEIQGVKNITYGYYETTRSWYWDNCDLEKMGVNSYYIYNDNAINAGDNGKYLFASEYVDTNEDIYNLIKQYCEDTDITYDDFKNGNKAIVFLDANSNGIYDDSIKDGTVLKAHNYYNYLWELVSKSEYIVKDKYSNANTRYGRENIFLSEEDSWTFYDLINYWIPRFTKDEVIELLSSYNGSNGMFVHINLDEVRLVCEKLKNDEITLNEIYELKNANYRGLIAGLYANKLMNEYYMKPAASTKVAKVIILNDEIKNVFMEYIPEFGQYTMLASKELVNMALDNQNELTKQYFRLDELPDSLTLKLQPNQISVTYGLDSAFTSTNHIVSTYLRQSGFACYSYSEQKDQLKQKTIEAIILYGFSALAALIVYLLVSMVIVSNRMEKHSHNLAILKQTGADKSVLVKIFMIECVRESIWCIVVFPVMLIIDYVIVRRKIMER